MLIIYIMFFFFLKKGNWRILIGGHCCISFSEPVMGRGRSRPQRNLLTRMDEVTRGPMSVLRNCMINKTRVKVRHDTTTENHFDSSQLTFVSSFTLVEFLRLSTILFECKNLISRERQRNLHLDRSFPPKLGRMPEIVNLLHASQVESKRIVTWTTWWCQTHKSHEQLQEAYRNGWEKRGWSSSLGSFARKENTDTFRS